MASGKAKACGSEELGTWTSMKESTRMTKNGATVSLPGLQETSIKVTIKRIFGMVMDRCFGLQGDGIKANGSTAISMVPVDFA